jgi:hypothetical protein
MINLDFDMFDEGTQKKLEWLGFSREGDGKNTNYVCYRKEVYFCPDDGPYSEWRLDVTLSVQKPSLQPTEALKGLIDVFNPLFESLGMDKIPKEHIINYSSCCLSCPSDGEWCIDLSGDWKSHLFPSSKHKPDNLLSLDVADIDHNLCDTVFAVERLFHLCSLDFWREPKDGKDALRISDEFNEAVRPDWRLKSKSYTPRYFDEKRYGFVWCEEEDGSQARGCAMLKPKSDMV